MLQPNAGNDGLSTAGAAPRGASIDVWTSFAGQSSDGGDWCESLPLDDRRIAMTVGDVAGHGDDVAPRKRAVRDSVLGAIGRLHSPSDVLAAANDVVCGSSNDSIVTAVVAYLDRVSLTLHYANAGHPPPLLVTDHESRYLTRRQADLPLGVFPVYASAPTRMKLAPGTIVVFYTDGITERNRDPIGGESELAAAARFAFDHREQDKARVIADRIFATERGGDDAAILVLRTWPVRLRYARPQSHR